MKLSEIFESEQRLSKETHKINSGIEIMTPQQFVAKYAEQDVAEGFSNDMSTEDMIEYLRQHHDKNLHQDYLNHLTNTNSKFVLKNIPLTSIRTELSGLDRAKVEQYKQMDFSKAPPIVVGSDGNILDGYHRANVAKALDISTIKAYVGVNGQQGVAESLEQLNRIRKLSGLEEATKLPVNSKEFGGAAFQNYMKRIVGTPDIDKKTGKVKYQKDRVTKKGEVVPGKEKYISGKTKSDKYKLPYVHRNSAIQYIGPDGETFSEEKMIAALKQRPKSLLKQNIKMRHSNGEQEQFFNIGFAALTGIAVDEQTDKLIIVNTCPGAGSCKVDCYVIQQGGKIQFTSPWLSDGRILTYLLNDPDGFFNQLSSEIAKEKKLGAKGGYDVTIRWHDSGDFFSPEYLDMALKMAAQHPDVKFYAYTKMAGAVLAKKPDNFIINWSEGANTKQEKQVKAQDPSLEKTKNSRIVPVTLFQDLLVKDEKKKLVKGPNDQWQVIPGKLPELKQRLAKEYGLSANSILSYTEYMKKRNSIIEGMKYNVIVMGGEGDVSANDPGVLSTLLLKH